MNTTRSATSRAKPISWVTTSMVMPSSASLRMTASTSPTSSGSSAEVGSSKSMRSGFMARARAIATRCCCPPDNCPGRVSHLSPTPTFSRFSLAMASASLLPRLSTRCWAIMTFCSAVMCGNRLNCWKTMPMRRRTASRSTSGSVTSTPSTKTLPLVGVSSRFTQRSSVDLPDPDGPMTHTTWPGSTVRSMPWSTSLSPKDLWRSAISMACVMASSPCAPPAGRRGIPAGW